MTDVVTLSYPEPRIARIALRDESGRNTFTPGICEGLVATIDAVSADAKAHAVVVHGYDNYFCTGATRDMLARITDGEISFSEFDLRPQ